MSSAARLKSALLSGVLVLFAAQFSPAIVIDTIHRADAGAPLMAVRLQSPADVRDLHSLIAARLGSAPAPAAAILESVQAPLAMMLRRDHVLAIRAESHLALIPLNPDRAGQALLLPVHPADPGTIKVFSLSGETGKRIPSYLNSTNTADAHDTIAHMFDGSLDEPAAADIVSQAVLDPAKPLDVHRAIKKRWIADAEFDDLAALHIARHGAHIGEIPAEILSVFPGRQEALRTIDRIAGDLLSHMEGGLWTQEKSIEEVSRAWAPLVISNVGSGDDGVVYKIDAGGRSFALKLYKHGRVFDEFRALTFFGAQGAKDSMQTYLAKLSHARAYDDVTWMLSEFIPGSPPLLPAQWAARGRSSIAAVAKKHGLYLGHIIDRVNGILVDAGPISGRSDVDVSDAEFLQQIEKARRALRETLDRARRR